MITRIPASPNGWVQAHTPNQVPEAFLGPELKHDTVRDNSMTRCVDALKMMC